MESRLWLATPVSFLKGHMVVPGGCLVNQAPWVIYHSFDEAVKQPRLEHTSSAVMDGCVHSVRERQSWFVTKSSKKMLSKAQGGPKWPECLNNSLQSPMVWVMPSKLQICRLGRSLGLKFIISRDFSQRNEAIRAEQRPWLTQGRPILCVYSCTVNLEREGQELQMQAFKSPHVKTSRLQTTSCKYDMHLGIKLITPNHRLIHLHGVSFQKFLKWLLQSLCSLELSRFSRKTRWWERLLGVG